MPQPNDRPERIADATARRLLERATMLDTDGVSLDHLREAAREAGISPAAFDAAVAEWRSAPATAQQPSRLRRIADPVLRNMSALALGWSSVAVLTVAQRLAASPWLVHKLTDPVGLAIGAMVAVRLRARPAAVLLGGLAISQGAEFLMDLLSGAPAIQGFGAHMGLMIAGVAGVAVGMRFLRRPSDSDDAGGAAHDVHAARSNERDASTDRTTRDSDTRFMEALRTRRVAILGRLQPG